ncbi:MAG TPA: RebB family R body protein [Pyrinomonadaceae bacterium]|jgi:hypothetical protein|nr:RebB family R body protein [Pyrinomonadaceae bacterium]
MTPAECAEFFAKTLEELNAVSQLQMQGILNVVTTGLEAAKSLSSSHNDPGAIEKLSKLVDELKSTAENLGNNKPGDFSADAPQSENFCAEVEANINIAMKNSLNDQQQLNVIGAAALTQIISLLISLEGDKASQN